MTMTPTREYLTSALVNFDPLHYDSFAAISDGANKLLMLVLAAVIKAGVSMEHEVLAEIKNAVISFIRKMESKKAVDAMLVSRVRVLYIRSLLSQYSELLSIKVCTVTCFLVRVNTRGNKCSSQGKIFKRSYMHCGHEKVMGFQVNIKPKRKSKLTSMVLRMRGIDEDVWWQYVSWEKIREIHDEAKSYAIGNLILAPLFVHRPAGEMQREVRSWLAENFEFLSISECNTSGRIIGELELISTAIVDGWMVGLGTAIQPKTDVLGQLLSEYSKRVYTSRLQHLKDISQTLAAKEAENDEQVAKLCCSLESVKQKRIKILQQMRSDVAILNLEDESSLIQNPSATEVARLASLVTLDGILKQVKDITKQCSKNFQGKTKMGILASIDELANVLPSLLDIDYSCALKHIRDARHIVESIPEEDGNLHELSHVKRCSVDCDVSMWNVLQFNTGSTPPFVIKFGANLNNDLVIKADVRVQEPHREIVRVAPKPSILEENSLDEIKEIFSQLPEALSLLALARTADSTRARYSRLYQTLALKVHPMRNMVGALVNVVK